MKRVLISSLFSLWLGLFLAWPAGAFPPVQEFDVPDEFANSGDADEPTVRFINPEGQVPNQIDPEVTHFGRLQSGDSAAAVSHRTSMRQRLKTLGHTLILFMENAKRPLLP